MFEFIGKWKDKITDYIDNRVNIIKLDIVERTSQVLSFFTFTIVCFLLVLPILLFLGMGIAEYIAELVGSRGGGYMIIAGIYLLALGILFACRKMFVRKFTGLFIKEMTDSDEDDDDEDEEQQTKK